MFNRPTQFIVPKEPLTPEEESYLKELQGLPHWQAFLKVHRNTMADITTDILALKDTRQSLDALTRLLGTIQILASDRPKPDSSLL